MIKDKAFAIAQACYIIIVAVLLRVLPGADLTTTLLAFAGGWFAISGIYRLTSWYSKTGLWTLLIATAILSVGIIANIYYFTTVSGGTTELPILRNFDSARIYNDALFSFGITADGAALINQHGYGLLASLLWHITGVSIVPLLIMNMLCILLVIILSGGIARNILQPSTDNLTAALAMIMTASVCYLMSSGSLLLKDAPLILAIALIGFSLASLRNGGNLVLGITFFSAGIVLVALLRFYFIIVAAVGILFFIRLNRRQLTASAILLCICAAAWIFSAVIYQQHGISSGEYAADMIGGNSLDNRYFFDSQQHRAYNEMVDGYFTFPWWKKLIYLPFSAAVQFLIPFPWDFSASSEFGYTQAYARIGYPWYLIGGLILYFLFATWKTAPAALKACFVWGALMWLMPAYLFAGTVSRYALPFIPLLIPAAAYVLERYRSRKSLRMWGAIYCSIIATALILSYTIQHSCA